MGRFCFFVDTVCFAAFLLTTNWRKLERGRGRRIQRYVSSKCHQSRVRTHCNTARTGCFAVVCSFVTVYVCFCLVNFLHLFSRFVATIKDVVPFASVVFVLFQVCFSCFCCWVLATCCSVTTAGHVEEQLLDVEPLYAITLSSPFDNTSTV